jgi:transcriptional regulator with XRE-family HTH domain
MNHAAPLLDREVVDELVREWAILSGSRLKAARLALNLKQDQVAGLAGTTVETVCRVELGQIAPREYLRALLASAVGKDVADIWPPFTRRELIRLAKAVA